MANDNKDAVQIAQEAEMAAHNADKQPAAPVPDHQFQQDGVTYEIVIGKFNHKGKVYTAKEAAADERVRAELVALAYESNEAYQKRTEEEFDENGILKIVY